MSRSSATSFPRQRLRLALLSALAASALVAHAVPAPQAATTDGAIHPAAWPQPAWPLPADAALERRLDALLATLSVEEKVGQVIQADIGSITPDELRKSHVSPPGHEVSAGSSTLLPAMPW